MIYGGSCLTCMGLTKINFNSCLFNDRMPVTIRFANEVGDVLDLRADGR